MAVGGNPHRGEAVARPWAKQAADAAERAAGKAEAAVVMVHKVVASTQSSRASAAAESSVPADKEPGNPWNKFQKDHAGKGLSMDRLRAEYYRQSHRK